MSPFPLPYQPVVKVTQGVVREGGKRSTERMIHTKVFFMAMGKRRREDQRAMWVAVEELPRSVSHPFYEKLNRL